MNKIFKVIWSKAKHCYIVASELAKSYSKGGGSRSIRRAATALCIAAVVYATAGSELAGSDYIGEPPDYNVTITEDVNGSVYGRKEDSNTSEEATVTINSGTVRENVYGGYVEEAGNAASNSVDISGDTTNILGNIYGGVASGTGKAYENKVNIATGSLKLVYGGYSESGSVASNSVNISGDTTKIKRNLRRICE